MKSIWNNTRGLPKKLHNFAAHVAELTDNKKADDYYAECSKEQVIEQLQYLITDARNLLKYDEMDPEKIDDKLQT